MWEKDGPGVQYMGGGGEPLQSRLAWMAREGGAAGERAVGSCGMKSGVGRGWEGSSIRINQMGVD